MLLLAIDTSTPAVTAGVVSMFRPHEAIAAQNPGTAASAPPKAVVVLSERAVTGSFAHGEQLMPLIAAALAESARALADLEAIVVGLGPGPFTGLRVGIATAQALGDALDIPVHGVGSHDAIACADLSLNRDATAEEFLVVTDARRREVYLSAYTGAGRRLFGPLPVKPAAVASMLAEHGLHPTRMIGAGTSLLGDVMLPGVRDTRRDTHGDTEDGTQGDIEGGIDGAGARQLSAGLVLAAARPLLTGVVPGPLVPMYLRRPDAAEPGARKSVLGR